MCCTRLAEIQNAKMTQKRHLRTIGQLCRALSSQLKHVSTIGKIVNSNISSRCSHNMANFGPLTAEIKLAGLGHPSKFQRASRLGFVTAATSLTRGQPNFAGCLAVFWAGTLYVHFRGLLSSDGIFPRAKFTLCPATHHRTLSGYILGTKACIDNGWKNLLNRNTSSTCPDNMANFGLLTAEICWRVWGTPYKFQRVSSVGSVTARHSSSGRQSNFAALNRGRQLYSAGRPSRWAHSSLGCDTASEALLKSTYTTAHCSFDSRPIVRVQSLKHSRRLVAVEFRWQKPCWLGWSILLVHKWAFCVLYFQRAACSTFQTCILNSH